MPNEDLDVISRIFRAIVYLIALIYAFLGSSVLSDRFMTAIEVITSHVRVVKITRKDGKVVNKSVRIWNETVAHLTLMEVGASASEILLTAIETAGHGFEAGELGPSAIVGSAAFSLFLITAICVLSVPREEVRRVERMDVFW
jgi:solute carrier family 8 (sodium/calcium exchanger)